jgi:hypothetical protein
MALAVWGSAAAAKLLRDTIMIHAPAAWLITQNKRPFARHVVPI